MEAIETAAAKKTKRKIHSALRIDMTPMVDLGFLLITFFIFTTTMSEKKSMKLFMPNEKGAPSPAPESKVLSVVLGEQNKVLAYYGQLEEAVKSESFFLSGYHEDEGIGKLIRNKQKQLVQADPKGGRDALVFLIKPTPGASYKNVIDALDESTINGVKKYMLLDASAEEKALLQKTIQ